MLFVRGYDTMNKRQPSLKLVHQWVFCFFAVTLFQRSIGFWGGMREELRKVRSPLPLQRSDLGRERTEDASANRGLPDLSEGSFHRVAGQDQGLCKTVL